MNETACPFCTPSPESVLHRAATALALLDRYPVTEGHTLIVPQRHVATWFEATPEEHHALFDELEVAREIVTRKHSPDGFNVGFNVGSAAGQTIPHLHIHLIPRYFGDAGDPTGGVRNVVPGKGNYLASPQAMLEGVPHLDALVRGEDDPLLPHLVGHLGGAARMDAAVAFVLTSGVRRLEPHLLDLVGRGGRIRLLTGDYLDVTEPDALRHLLDIQQVSPDAVELRVFHAGDRSFHPKSYIFIDQRGNGLAFVGSSNLTEPALGGGLEWNYRVVSSMDHAGFTAVARAFEDLLVHPSTRYLDHAWIDEYAARREKAPTRVVEVVRETPEPPPVPHKVQSEALAALQRTRAEGNKAGLVVLATGLGKTWLSAFDSIGREFRRILFVAHREEILAQAMATFRRIRPQARLGHYSGAEKDPGADILFASVQTLSRKSHLERFAAADFDYIVVDEFHHAHARTYRRLIEYFAPKFLLGLTATPERTDGGDLLALCGENLVYRCDLAEGIRRGLLCPFHYFGVPDDVDYRNIPWRSTRFDPEALTNAVATTARAENALQQLRTRGGKRTLAFCCSTRHADYMAAFFHESGLRAVAVHSEPSSAPRAKSLEMLERGDLDVVVAVDMFNEGVDLPNIDTVMMLRPTESRILWLQQLGRGLRKADRKPHLNVIDYIGNHRTFLLKPQTLLGLGSGDWEVAQALERLAAGQLELPPGCEVTYELKTVDILRGLLRIRDPEPLRAFYEDFKDRHGLRPTASEASHEGYNLRALRKSHGSWLGFVHSEGDLDKHQEAAYQSCRVFLEALESTEMNKSYKMLVLLAMLNTDRFPEGIEIHDLMAAVRHICERSARLRADVGPALDDDAALRRLLEVNPIAAWTGGRGTGGTVFFRYEEARFTATLTLTNESRGAVQELTRELVEWRLAEYLLRPGGVDPGAILIKVNHVQGRPNLLPLLRDRYPQIPTGPTPVLVNGEELELDFVKVAVNVARRRPGGPNELPAILRGWFGPDAGLPGTNHRVELLEEGGRFVLRPFAPRADDLKLELWKRYSREEIPPLFGREFNPAIWNSGFVMFQDSIFLLVTLKKGNMMSEHKYEDRFLSPTVFQWQSQNRTTQASKAGRMLWEHRQRGIDIHLFVRADKKRGPRSAPFVYCGPAEFQGWEGERPITVRVGLPEPVPDRLRDELLVPRDA